MSRALTPATPKDRERIVDALAHLTAARTLLKDANASPRCVDKVRAAIKSAEGAERHVQGRIDRARA